MMKQSHTCILTNDGPWSKIRTDDFQNSSHYTENVLICSEVKTLLKMETGIANICKVKSIIFLVFLHPEMKRKHNETL
jgi:hypothetical protein